MAASNLTEASLAGQRSRPPNGLCVKLATFPPRLQPPFQPLWQGTTAHFGPLKKLLPTVLGLVCLVLAGAGINALLAARAKESQAQESKLSGPKPALPVETIELVPTDRLETIATFTGQVAARQAADLAFEGTGRVLELLVDEGELVQEGQVLGRLDRAQLQAQRGEIAARRVRLEAQLDELLKGPRSESIDAASANVAAVQEEADLARLQRDRRAELAKKGTISAELLDTTQAAVKLVEARLAAAKAQLAELENGTRPESVAAQRGALLELDAALESIDVAISKTTLKAPFDGTIAARHLDTGAVVSLQMPTAAFRIVETGALEVHVGVPAELIPADGVAAGSVRLKLRDVPVSASAMRVLPNVDPGTRTVTVIYELDRASAQAAGARPGDIATLERTIHREERGAWIPITAMSESERGLWSAFAFVPSGDSNEDSAGTAQRIELEVLSANETHAFVRGTFDARTTIVASGVNRLVPGQRIKEVAVTDGSAAGR